MVADLTRFIGRFPDSLTYEEWDELNGKWGAFEFYSPSTLPLRALQAVGESAGECRRQLKSRGLNPAAYEYVPFKKPF